MSIPRLPWCLPLLLVALSGSGVVAAHAAPPPVLTLEPSALVVSGITPKGKVVWFGMAREMADYAETLVRRDRVLEDVDGDGSVRLDLGKPVPRFSVWIAVDLTSGAFAVATPQGSRAVELAIAGRNPGRGGAGDTEWTETGNLYLEMAVIRPGQGAWAATVGDGEDADGQITASLRRMRSVTEGIAAPEAFSPGDLVVVIDPNILQYYVETLAPLKP